jgi:RNA polymerase sigma factor (sigma-70 family)
MKRFIDEIRGVLIRRDGAGLSDGQLLARFTANRDEDAFVALVRRHSPMVYGVCQRVLRNHHDAEDAYQATFVVLAKKAASIRTRETVGNWLYGVAHRTALEVRSVNARRRAKEENLKNVLREETLSSESNSDLRDALDDELSRLPDKYRVAIVLCDLEGRKRAEVARDFGIPEGTLCSRLATAHKMLAKRLARFNSQSPVAPLTAALLGSTTAVPAELLRTTVKVALTIAAGNKAGAVSATVTLLAERVVKAMLLSKLKIGVLLACAAVMLAGGGVAVVGRSFGIGQSQDPPGPVVANSSPTAPSFAEERKETSTLLQESHQVLARKEIERILLCAQLRIMDGEEAKEKRANCILLIDPESGEWKGISIDSAPHAREPRLSPDGKTIAFGNWPGFFPDRETEQSIWTCDVSGGNLKQIFNKGSRALWSADGKHLIVTSESTKQLAGGNWEFKTWQIGPDGSNPMELPLPATDCAIDSSPDGKWITTISGRPQPFKANGFQIYITRPDATNERLLTQGGANIDPRFSPDSKNVLYTGFEQGTYKAWTVEIQGGKRTEIYHQDKRESALPTSACWSPDGKRIAMIVHDWERSDDGKLFLQDPEKGNYRIIIMDAQGQNIEQLKLKNARLIGGDRPEWR